MRVNIMINEEDLKLIDKRAKEMYMSRSAFLAFCAVQKVKTDALLDSLPKHNDLKALIDDLSNIVSKTDNKLLK